jgi:hypothetical protein
MIGADSLGIIDAWGTEMVRKGTKKLRPWTKEDVRMLTTLAREKVKTTVIARKLKRSVGAMRNKALRIGVSFGAPRAKTKAA